MMMLEQWKLLWLYRNIAKGNVIASPGKKQVKELMAEFKTEYSCMLLIQNLVHMFLDEGLASEIGPLEDKDSVGAIGTLEFFKGCILESLPNSLKHLTLDTNAMFRCKEKF
ncbi:hypothetical protein HAX54_021463 [Datura stramonium]|uniref:Uncharacterized protein n=1 Tax=Datura stramonium TaxID=4076 RepID=A0ABS8UV72_DATST|nr:hypothetical protein [Datura stramonium]